MINNPLFHPITHNDIQQLIAHPKQAILIKGAEGSGKYYTAQYIACSILGITPEKLAIYPYFYKFSPVKNSISIENIRSLIQKAQLKTIGTNEVRRIMIVQDAHYMTAEAQNALLKLLEEPPEDTVMMLTTSRPNSLLSTIHSRTSTLHIKPLEKSVLRNHFNSVDEKMFTSHYHISDSSIGLMHTLIHNDNNDTASSIQLAKLAVTKSSLERFGLVEQITKTNTEQFLESLVILSRAGLKTAQTTKQQKRWFSVLTSSVSAQHALQKNAHPKLVITNLMTEL